MECLISLSPVQCTTDDLLHVSSLQGIELSNAQWGALFEPYLFFESYKNYLQVDIVAVDIDDLRAWKGWVESRLRQLTLMVISLLLAYLWSREDFGQLQFKTIFIL